MNTDDDRISAALHARAEGLTEADLSPATPPGGRRTPPGRGRWTVPLLAAAIVGIVAAATVVKLNRSHDTTPAVRPTVSVTPSPSQPPSRPAATSSGAPSSGAPSSGAPSSGASTATSTAENLPFVLGYQPLWPFASYAQAEQWRTQAGGSQPWHLDAGQTALSFTRSYLGFTEIDEVASTRLDTQGAHVGVGYRDPTGRLSIAAVLHLARYGSAKDSPWEVVGSDDTTFTLEQPAYGSRVSSPMTVGGHITGVDENIVVSVLASQTDRATVARVPAGGTRSAWSTGTVSFGQRGVLTIVASTGGHLQQVERFAIQGVHT